MYIEHVIKHIKTFECTYANFTRAKLGNTQVLAGEVGGVSLLVQGYLAHKKTPNPLG